MNRFRLWRLLQEQLDAQAYNGLFDDELERLLPRLADPVQRQHAQGMRGFNWTRYIAAAVRRAFSGQDEVDEKVHEIVIRMLVDPGNLFRKYDERLHGPFPLRFKRSIANAVKNFVEKERNRRRYIPAISIRQEFVPGGVTPNDLPARSPAPDDKRLVSDFRRLVRRRLGELGVAVLDVRMADGETKSLVGNPDFGSPGKWIVKRVVQQVKELAREYAESLGDPGFLRDIERAMKSESETVGRRQATMKRRAEVVK